MHRDYTRFSVADIEHEFEEIAREARVLFGALDESQLNWKPDASRWSIAQCLDHLLTIDPQMFDAMDAAMDPARPKSLAQRLPVLPRLFGRVMITSLSPQAARRFRAPKTAMPSASALDAGIVERFIDHQTHNVQRVRAVAGRHPHRVIMRSPFAPIAYSVLDACRIVCAHERRHFEQARRVTKDPAFPAGPRSTNQIGSIGV